MPDNTAALIAECRARLEATPQYPASDVYLDYLVWAGDLVPRLLAALETAHREPIGYMVAHTAHDGSTSFARTPYGRRENAEAHAARRGSTYRVVELREVSDRG
jgi:hypothetical protein